MMALSASICNLSEGLFASLMGAFINSHFVGMSKEDFNDKPSDTVTRFWILCVVGIVGCLYEFCIIPLIPIRSEIEAEIENREQQRKDKALEAK